MVQNSEAEHGALMVGSGGARGVNASESVPLECITDIRKNRDVPCGTMSYWMDFNK